MFTKLIEDRHSHSGVTWVALQTLQGLENMHNQQMEKIKELIDNKITDPNEYAEMFPDLSREELDNELKDTLAAMNDKLDTILSNMGNLREGVDVLLQDKQGKDQKALSRTVSIIDPKKAAMALELDLDDIHEAPLATGGFGAIHQARFVTPPIIVEHDCFG